MKVFNVVDIEGLEEVSQYLLELSDKYKIFLLIGDLGAGKTTLVKRWVEAMGIAEEVSSPTYAIANIYHGSGIIVNHIDLYRIRDLDEAYEIGIEEYLLSGQYCFIEWPEIIREILSDSYVEIMMVSDTNNQRKIDITEFVIED